MKIFLDDVRNPPDKSWSLARTFDEAVRFLEIEWPSHVSLDNDLADQFGREGHHFLAIIERAVIVGGKSLPELSVHSMNPVARQSMLLAIQRLKERTQ